MLDHLVAFSISLLIGLLLGIERERNHLVRTHAIGVRTFILFSLLGTLTATLGKMSTTITISSFVFGIILVNYFRTSAKAKLPKKMGITTELAAASIFCLGYLVPTKPFISITLAGVIFLTLIERKRLHYFAKNKFEPHEIEAAIILTIFALAILPILPKVPVDKWGLFNPYNLGILIVAIGAIQFAGYVAIRLFGQRFGMALTGLVGGIISSTVVFATINQRLKDNPRASHSAIAYGLLAIVAMLVEIFIIIFIASQKFALHLAWMIGTMTTVSLILSIIMLYKQPTTKTYKAKALPVNLFSVIRIAVFLAAAIIVITIAKKYFGISGIVLVSFLGGLFEIHGIAVATALLYLGNKLALTDSYIVISAAILASFISKYFLLFTLTPLKFAIKCSLALSLVLLSGGIAFYLTL